LPGSASFSANPGGKSSANAVPCRDAAASLLAVIFRGIDDFKVATIVSAAIIDKAISIN
jgi:hypothetical protein